MLIYTIISDLPSGVETYVFLYEQDAEQFALEWYQDNWPEDEPTPLTYEQARLSFDHSDKFIHYEVTEVHRPNYSVTASYVGQSGDNIVSVFRIHAETVDLARGQAIRHVENRSNYVGKLDLTISTIEEA